MQVKGIIPKKEQPKTPPLNESVDSIIKVVDDLKVFKKDINETFDAKKQEIEKIVDKAKQTVDQSTQKIDKKLAEFEQTAINLIQDIHSIPNIKGEKGDPGILINKEELIKDFLKRVPRLAQVDIENISEIVLSKVPKPTVIDDKELAKRVIKYLPREKSSLKDIQDKIETDPMSVIEKIMALPEGKFKLKFSQIDGLDQTIRSFQSQLGRGYLHGGGLSKVIHDATLTGDGTVASPLSVVGGGGGGNPALPFNSFQFNDAGSFGGSSDLTYDASNHFIYVGTYSHPGFFKTLDAGGGNTNGVAMFFETGTGEKGGNFQFSTGNSTSNDHGGDFDFSSGLGDFGGRGGNMNFTAGDGGSAGDGGGFNLYAGYGNGANGNGGDVYLGPGGANGGGANGHVIIQDPMSGNSALFETSELTGNHTYTFPNQSGTFDVITDKISLLTQSADIPDTAFSVTTPGLYRVVYYILTTTADAAAGTVIVNINYTDDASSRTQSSFPLDLTSTSSSFSFIEQEMIVRLDSGNITYGTTHTGIYGTSEYSFYITLEKIW